MKGLAARIRPSPDTGGNPMPSQRTCSITNCNRVHIARGWCEIHYRRWKRHGDPTGKSTETPLAERLWSGAVADGTGCWPWQRSRDPSGYGRIQVGGRSTNGGRLLGAHRIAYKLVKGPIPEGLQIDHLCRNRRCINPDHLEAVTMRENTLRGFGVAACHARQTHCKRGHPFDEANTDRGEAGRRRCRICTRLRVRARYHNESIDERARAEEAGRG